MKLYQKMLGKLLHSLNDSKFEQLRAAFNAEDNRRNNEVRSNLPEFNDEEYNIAVSSGDVVKTMAAYKSRVNCSDREARLKCGQVFLSLAIKGDIKSGNTPDE